MNCGCLSFCTLSLCQNLNFDLVDIAAMWSCRIHDHQAVRAECGQTSQLSSSRALSSSREGKSELAKGKLFTPISDLQWWISYFTLLSYKRALTLPNLLSGNKPWDHVSAALAAGGLGVKTGCHRMCCYEETGKKLPLYHVIIFYFEVVILVCI